MAYDAGARYMVTPTTDPEIIRRGKALEFRETFLKTLSSDPGVDVCCEAARAYMGRQAGVA